MIIFEFEKDPGVVEEDRKYDVINADASALQETFFVMPIHLVVNAVDLFVMP